MKLKVLRGINSFVNSSIAASQIKTLSLGGIQYANGSIPFGVAAQAPLIPFTTTAPSTGKPFTFKKLISQTIVTADFSAKGDQPAGFCVTDCVSPLSPHHYFVKGGINRALLRLEACHGANHLLLRYSHCAAWGWICP